MIRAQVFGPLTFRGFPAMMKAYPQLQSQAKYEIYKDVDTQLRRALDIKDKVTYSDPRHPLEP